MGYIIRLLVLLLTDIITLSIMNIIRAPFAVFGEIFNDMIIYIELYHHN